MALRIVYFVSQFAAPLHSISSQLIYGPILLLLAVAWYPFHPQRLMAIMIWVFIAAGVLVTLLVLLQVDAVTSSAAFPAPPQTPSNSIITF